MDGGELLSGVNASINAVHHDPAAVQARSSQVIAVAAAFLVLGWMAVALRVYVRLGMLRNFRIEDFLTVFTMTLFSVFCILVIVITSSNAGIKSSSLNLPDLPNITTCLVTAVAFYIITMIFFKIALGIFYLRIIVSQWQKYTVYTVMVISTLYGFVFLFVALFECGSPTDFLVKMYQGKCMSTDAVLTFALVGGIINAVTDWVLALLPICIVQKANLDRRAKLSTAAILLLAVMGSVASIVRLAYIKGLEPNTDFFWKATNVGIWTTIEPGLGITAACLATSRPLFQRMMGHRDATFSGDAKTLVDFPHKEKRLSRKEVTEVISWHGYMAPRFDYQLRSPADDPFSSSKDASDIERATFHGRDSSSASKKSNNSGYSLHSTKALPPPPEPAKSPTTISTRHLG